MDHNIKMNSYFKSNQKERGFALPLLLLAIVLLVVGAAYWINKNNSSKNMDNQLAEMQSKAAPVDTRDGQDLPEAMVTITDKGFMPESVMVKAGQKITWQNTDSKAHKIVPDSLAAFPDLNDVDPIPSNETLSIPFDKQGTFSLHDADSSQMHITVIVN